jgi:mono/diheme cytochrome c family protein
MRFLRLALVLWPVFCAGCLREPPPIVKGHGGRNDVNFIDQGLTAADRDRFYHLTMGSEIVPLAWLRALESISTGQPFLDNAERFGLIPDPDSDDSLPVGLTAAPSKDARFAGKMVGFNCAACHTGEMTCHGKTVRIDGGASLFDAEAFTKDLLVSLIATLKSPEKLVAFVKRQLQEPEYAAAKPAAHRLLSGDNLAALEKAFAKLHQEEQKSLKSLAIDIDMQLHDDRAAAQAKLRELIGTIDLGDLPETIAADLKGDAAAVRETLTHLVETMRLMKARLDFAKKAAALGKLQLENTHGGPGRVDDFGAARVLLFDIKYAQAMNAPCSVPHLWGAAKIKWSDYDGSTQSTLERSVATALAGGAVFDPTTYQSTVSLRNLGELEALSAKITAPAWPEDVFGKIDRAKAERGAVHFKEHCAKCHGPPDLLFDRKAIGTDPQRLLNYAVPLGKRSFAAAVQAETGKYVARAAKDDKVSAQELEKFRAGHKNIWRTTNKYAARPLAAIWATPPYLHNGSVPTIYDLLLPANQRPKTFPLGQRDYDPVKLGYVTAIKGEPIFRLDTSIIGNRNVGHEYGTTLSDEQRYELIEFLKAN